jgi:GTP pyrophosphokinase
VVDFAYAIHTQIGNKMKSAKVHGKAVSLDYILKYGDVVEIATEEMAGPDRSWLDYAMTVETKAKIRHQLKHERGREANISSGKEFVKGLLTRYSSINDINNISNIRLLSVLAKKCRCRSLEDFFEAIGYGGIGHSHAAFLIQGELKKMDELPQFKRELTTNVFKLEVETSTPEELNNVMASLNKIGGVINVERIKSDNGDN